MRSSSYDLPGLPEPRMKNLETSSSSRPRGLRVGLLNRGDPATDGSSRVRAFQFAPHLESFGIQVRSLTWDSRSRASLLAYALRAASLAASSDIIWLQKPCQHPLFLRSLASLNPRIVVDFDDAVWAPSTGCLRPGRSTRVSRTYGKRLVSALRLARVVTPGNRYLARFARRIAGEAVIQLLPSVVDLARYPLTPPRLHGSPITVGWVGSAGNHQDFNNDVRFALEELTVRGTVRLSVMSNQRPDFGFPFDFTRWSLDSEVHFLRRLDVGIMPLQNTPRARGRCGFKALLYMASELPVVASPVGAAFEVIESRVSGLLARDAEDWIAALSSLAGNPEQRRTMGTAGRHRVEARYSLNSALPTLVQILRGVAKSPRDLVSL